METRITKIRDLDYQTNVSSVIERIAASEKNRKIKCLNIGCGKEVIPYFLKNSNCDFYGADNLPYLKYAKNLKKCNLERDRIPFKNNSFDIAISVFVLEHLKNPANLFKEAKRVLKKGGLLIFLTPNSNHPVFWLGRRLPFLRKLYCRLTNNKFQQEFEAYWNCNTSKEIIKSLRGYNIRKIFLFGSLGAYLPCNSILQKLLMKIYSPYTFLDMAQKK